ncbi:MAG: cyclic nucleotide-binding domain-containing protein [Polyangiales bacterium]
MKGPGAAELEGRDTERARALRVLLDALERRGAARDTYLDEACGADLALRTEVESLLAQREGRGAPAEPPGRPRYHELHELGVGSCGRVTRAWDSVLRRVVALKEAHAGPEPLRGMLEHEARLLAYLDHPGAVSVFEGRFEGRAHYTMRVLDGETVHQRLAREGRLSVSEAVRVTLRVSETMANAHAKGVLHLDLKPANVMLLPYGQVCVLDWGIARFYDLSAYRAYLAAANAPPFALERGYQGVAGTPAYMPFEQAAGEGISPATDIYACGTMLYEMLAGRLPHGPILSLLDKAAAEFPPLRSLRADVPAALASLCERMLSPLPVGRPESFDEVLTALERLSRGDGAAEERALTTGEVLFREGDAGTVAYQILSGSLSVSVEGPDGPKQLARRGVGELIGEMAVVSGAPRSATATAAEPTRVAVVTREVIERALESANPMVAKMLRELTERLQEAAERAREGR